VCYVCVEELRSDNDGPPVVYPELVRAFRLEVQRIEERTDDRIPIASLFSNINYNKKSFNCVNANKVCFLFFQFSFIHSIYFLI
jgi:hypothetical protein